MFIYWTRCFIDCTTLNLMARNIYVASVEGHTIKSAVALGVLDSLVSQYPRVGVFRAVSPQTLEVDPILNMLHHFSTAGLNLEDCVGANYLDVHASPDKALAQILERFKKVEALSDAMVIIGSDYTDVVSPTELSFNARVAANLGAPMVLVLSGRKSISIEENLGQSPARSALELSQVAELAMQEIADEHTTLLAAVVNRAEPDRDIAQAVSEKLPAGTPVWVMAEDSLLVAPRMEQILEAVDGQLLFGDSTRLQDEALDVVVAAMSEVNVLARLKEAAVVVAPSDRTDVLLPLLMADSSETFPRLAGIILNGGFELPETIQRLIQGLKPTVPVIASGGGSFDTTMKVIRTRGTLSLNDPGKIARARKLFDDHVPRSQLAKLMRETETTAITPLMFESLLAERARGERRTIVLPEGNDDRVLQAADEILRKQIAGLIILGDPGQIKSRAKELSLDLSAATLIEIKTSEYFEDCVSEYVKLRSHKGMTLEKAREIMLDESYFGTMLVQLGIADGMVSGARHTTAHTITPSFQIIKTQPGVSVVSSVFLMALRDRVVVYGDCAVIPEPTATELADIAISSANTARAFNIEPHVAMLSYSTGTSGSGADVDRVREATELVRQRAPELSVEGPIQFDAAVDAGVAKTKLPESTVAGRATVFVFPDLNTGNNTYKAVQRTAGALAIGPILQGLNKPVNDLSRGALVKDIVNTIAITAIQAGATK
jgi:phosphate acetyltransferase